MNIHWTKGFLKCSPNTFLTIWNKLYAKLRFINYNPCVYWILCENRLSASYTTPSKSKSTQNYKDKLTARNIYKGMWTKLDFDLWFN